MTAQTADAQAPASDQPVTGTPRLNAALARVQAELPRIVKDETAKVTSERTGQSFTYSYADLAGCSAAIMPLLGKNGLAFTAKPTLVGGKFGLVYKLVHESGESDEGFYPLLSEGKFQEVGSAITYARRYCLCAVTGIAPDKDDDDAAAANNQRQRFDAQQSAGAAFDTAESAPSRGAGARQGSPTPAPRPPVEVPPLDPEDPWRDAIDAIADKEDGAARYAEVRKLLAGGQVDQARSDRLCAAITARVTNLGLAGRPAAGGEPAGDGQATRATPDHDPFRAAPAGPTAPAADGPAAEWIAEWRARLAEATEDTLLGLQREVGSAIGKRLITAQQGGLLSDAIRGRRAEFAGQGATA